MPILTNWLEMPEAPSSGQALFPTLPSQQVGMSARGQVTPDNIFNMATQRKIQAMERFSMYQRNLRKEQEGMQVEEQAKQALSYLGGINPRSPDYLDRRAKIIGQLPLASQHPSVASVIAANDMVHSQTQRLQEVQARRDQEVTEAIIEDPSLSALYDSELPISGENGAKRKVASELHNRKLILSLIDAGHSGEKADLAPLLNEYNQIDTFKAGRYIAGQKKKLLQRRGLEELADIQPRLAEAREEAALEFGDDPAKINASPQVAGWLAKERMVKEAYGLQDIAAPSVGVQSIKLKSPTNP